LEEGGKERMVNIINVLGLDKTESLRMKLLMGLLYKQTRTVMKEYGISVD